MDGVRRQAVVPQKAPFAFYLSEIHFKLQLASLKAWAEAQQ
jgi:hypothetical protein